jgi:hypothetical protein
MTKYSKYLNTFFFAIAALSVIDFMTRDGMDSAARYQYRDFEFGLLYRNIADSLLLTSLLYLLLQEWNSTINKYLFNIASIMYIGIIMIDMNVWLWWTQWSWLYYYITLIHTLPIFVILTKLNFDIKPKHLFFISFTIVLLGFLFDTAFIQILSVDMTDELYKKTIRLEKVRNLIYYFGFITTTFALITLVKRIKLENTDA